MKFELPKRVVFKSRCRNLDEIKGVTQSFQKFILGFYLAQVNIQR